MCSRIAEGGLNSKVDVNHTLRVSDEGAGSVTIQAKKFEFVVARLTTI